jgi:hypothetical protein
MHPPRIISEIPNSQRIMIALFFTPRASISRFNHHGAGRPGVARLAFHRWNSICGPALFFCRFVILMCSEQRNFTLLEVNTTKVIGATSRHEGRGCKWRGARLSGTDSGGVPAAKFVALQNTLQGHGLTGSDRLS